MAISTSDKVDFRTKNIAKDKEVYFIMKVGINNKALSAAWKFKMCVEVYM